MKRIIKQTSPKWFENWKTNFRTANGKEPHYKNDFQQMIQMERIEERICEKNL